MTVRCILFALAAWFTLMLGAGCSGGDPIPIPAEADEPGFREGLQRLREGRAPEALTWFLKVIEKRGVQNAPESHLQAGVIYLQHIRDPIEAYHHFRKYLQLQPNSREASLVRQQIDAAKREFAATLPARPEENQTLRFESAEEIERLRRENAELRAENATLRGGAVRPPRSMLTIPDATAPAAPLPADASPITAAPAAPARTAAGSALSPRTPAPRPAAPATAPAPSGRTYTVQPRDGLFAIARRFDAANTSRKLSEIVEANPDVLPDGVNTPLKPGMVLRIP